LITWIIIGEEYRSFSSSLCSFVHSSVNSTLLGPNIYIWVLVLMYLVIRLLSPDIKKQGLNWIINIVSHYSKQKHLFAVVIKIYFNNGTEYIWGRSISKILYRKSFKNAKNL
jgi:hypothetical protein